MKKNPPLHLFICALAVVVFAAACGQTGDEGEGRISPVVANLDVDIVEAASGGYWADNSHSGTSRLVVGSYGTEHLYSALYAQWIGAEKTSGEISAVATTEIDELSHQPLFIIADVTFIMDWKGEGAAFDVVLAHRYSDELKNARVNLGLPTIYTVSPPFP